MRVCADDRDDALSGAISTAIRGTQVTGTVGFSDGPTREDQSLQRAWDFSPVGSDNAGIYQQLRFRQGQSTSERNAPRIFKSVGLRTSAQALATQKNHFGLNHSHIETDLIAVPCYRIFVIAWHLEVVLLSAIAASAQSSIQGLVIDPARPFPTPQCRPHSTRRAQFERSKLAGYLRCLSNFSGE